MGMGQISVSPNSKYCQKLLAFGKVRLEDKHPSFP